MPNLRHQFAQERSIIQGKNMRKQFLGLSFKMDFWASLQFERKCFDFKRLNIEYQKLRSWRTQCMKVLPLTHQIGRNACGCQSIFPAGEALYSFWERKRELEGKIVQYHWVSLREFLWEGPVLWLPSGVEGGVEDQRCMWFQTMYRFGFLTTGRMCALLSD